MKTSRWVPLFLALCLATVAFPGDPAGALDGRRFAVEVTDGHETLPDTLIFENGTFDSVECRQYGFGAVEYHATKKGDSWTFSAQATSEKEGVARWEGIVDGDSISGSMVWSKAGQDPVRYEYEGKAGS